MQFPLNYNKYKDYRQISNIVKLPLPESGEMYDNWKLNNNHYTPIYHRKNVITTLCQLLDINFKEDDFILVERKTDGFDTSYYRPKKEYTYEIFGFDLNEHLDNASFDDLITCNINKREITGYHKMYRYPHMSSRIINKTIDSNRKLFISGDSQMIPEIPFLSCFFNEVWYMDNRGDMHLANKYKDIDFSDVLIELNCNVMEKYIVTNLI